MFLATSVVRSAPRTFTFLEWKARGRRNFTIVSLAIGSIAWRPRGGRLIAISFQHLRAARAGKSRLAHTWAINVYPRTIRRVFRITSASGNGVGCAWACKRPATAANVERNSTNVYRPGLIRAFLFFSNFIRPSVIPSQRLRPFKKRKRRLFNRLHS